jgi:hypothetical protein
LRRMKQSVNSVGHSAASPRQVPLSLHLSVGYPLHSLTQILHFKTVFGK